MRLLYGTLYVIAFYRKLDVSKRENNTYSMPYSELTETRILKYENPNEQMPSCGYIL